MITDGTGHEIKPGDWVAYATRSWGQHALKIARVKELLFGTWNTVMIENFDCNGKLYNAVISPSYMVVISEDRVPIELLDKFDKLN